MKDFTIQPAQRIDLEFVTDCARLAYQQYVADIGKEPAPMVADFGNHFQRSELHIIRFGKHRAGYVVWRLKDDHLFVDNIALLPSFSGKGLARASFDWLAQKALNQGKTTLKLYTNEKMYGNLKLYPHLGFAETHRVFEDGFNRIYFQKRL